MFAENPDLDSSKVWNCDESGFPTDLSKRKVIAPKVIGCNHLFVLDYFSSILVLHERCNRKLTSAFFMQGKKWLVHWKREICFCQFTKLTKIKSNNLLSSLIFFIFLYLIVFFQISKEETSFKVSPGAGWENITVLAVCSACEVALDLLIV